MACKHGETACICSLCDNEIINNYIKNKELHRQELITQLRAALHQVESPTYELIEFTIGDIDFSFDFSV